MANTLDPFVPELWAQESLQILNENLVAASRVHRDFEDEIKSFGDVVNTRLPAKFTAVRKINSENVTVQDADSTNVAVPLDQHWHTSFRILDGEESKSFQSLVEIYLRPAVMSIAQMIDKIVLGQAYRFLLSSTHSSGRLGIGDSTTIKGDILGARQALNDSLCPPEGRNLFLTSQSETDALSLDNFITADKIGDDGTRLREASIGRILGFDTFMSQNVMSPSSGTTTAGAMDVAAVAGDTLLPVAANGDETINHWLTVAGDETPQMVISATGGVSLVVWPGLKRGVTNSAVTTHLTQGDVNGAQVINFHGPIIHDGGQNVSVGQMITFGVGATTAATALALAKYTIVDIPTAGEFTLDRPLEVAIANDAKINFGPLNEFNIAMDRNAIALITRPLAMPRAGTGALSAVLNANSIALRVTITYDGVAQGTLVTVDVLGGVQLLDVNRGVLMYG